jgi:hypothetical protein
MSSSSHNVGAFFAIFMSGKMTFCEECRKDVTYSVEIASMKGILKGEEYSYTGKKPTCAECDSEVYVAEIEDEVLVASM